MGASGGPPLYMAGVNGADAAYGRNPGMDEGPQVSGCWWSYWKSADVARRLMMFSIEGW